MIVSKQKPFAEILAALAESRKIFLVGCAKCATVCKSGGEEEIWQMQEQLASAGKEVTGSIVIDEACHMLRAGRDLRGRKEMVGDADALLVLACGAGVQFSAEIMEPLRVLPALNTRFIGITAEEGAWSERCRACGSCLLGDYGGICPVTICAKGLLNGACGGSKNGKCEASQEKDCAWVLIYNRLKKQNRLDALRSFTTAKDFSVQAHPGQFINEAYLKPKMEEKSAQ